MLRSFFCVRPGLAFVGLSLVFVVLPAGAQGGKERPRYVLQSLDLDHDGTLSPQEIQAAPSSLRALDRNGDGELTPDELEAPRTDAGASPDQMVALLMSFDRNKDGVLTADELPERMQAMFVRGDKNKDGKLTPDEIRQMAARTGSPNGRAAGAGTASGVMRLDPVLNALDTNHDGVISAAEINAASANLLVLDVDHDGAIASVEMRVRQQTPTERVAHLLDEWDTDKDGKLSKAEAPDGMRSRFDVSDKNGDGFLDSEELVLMFSTTQQPTRDSEPAHLNGQPKGQNQ